MILLRPSGLRWRFLVAGFFAVEPLRPEPLFFTGAVFRSASRFAAQRRLIATANFLRPAGLMARFLEGACSFRWDAVALPDTRVPVISRNAEMARSIADRCCSSSEMILSMSFNENSSGVMLVLPGWIIANCISKLLSVRPTEQTPCRSGTRLSGVNYFSRVVLQKSRVNAPIVATGNRSILTAGGIEAVTLPPRSPNLNAFAERWVRKT